MARVPIYILMLSFLYGSAFAQRSVRRIFQQPAAATVDTMHDQIAINAVSVKIGRNDILLTWQPARNTHPASRAVLTGYRIFSGTTSTNLTYISTVRYTQFRHKYYSHEPTQFYRVIAFYGGRAGLKKPPTRINRDDVILFDFEDENLELLPYSDEEDIDRDAWEITDEESMPESEHSLALRGNTWKRMIFERTDLSDTTVWSLGIMVVQGDTMARQQAFGIGDGVNTLYYTFYGMETFWDHDWNIASQNAHPRERWNVHRLAVGYDFKIRFGYLPSIDELYFINDNDNNEELSAVIYFDQLVDITESIPPEPVVKVRWRERDDLDVQGDAIQFTADVDNRDIEDLSFFWEFGDGSTSTQRNPTHVFQNDGRYTVAVTVSDQDGNSGGEIVRMEIGQSRIINRLNACFTGDVMLARRYEGNGGIITRFGPETVFARIADRLSQADLLVVNLESVLTDEGVRHPSKQFVFRGRPANVAGLTYAGIDIATLANNHMSDFGRRGLEETMEVLDAARIAYCGAGMNEYDALKPVFRTINGIRIGVLAYCNRTGRDENMSPFLDASFDTYGYAYFSPDNILRTVADANDLCDFLVVTIHGGLEYAIGPANVDPDYPEDPDGDGHEHLFDHHAAVRDSATRELEHLCIDLGADLIISHHPHVLQGFEVYRDAVIAHSLGNFAFDQYYFETWVSTLLNAEIDADGLREVTIEPVFVDGYRPTPAVGALGRKILDRLAGYSYKLNAILVPQYNQMKAQLVYGDDQLIRHNSEHETSGVMRYYEDEGLYRSEPIRLTAGGFPSQIVSISPDAQDAEWEISFGREIALVGNMEPEGADIWNYNSINEGREEEIVHGGRYSSWIFRRAGWQDGITELKQRIKVDQASDRLTLCGYLRTTNCRDVGLAAKYFRYRLNSQNQNIFGIQMIDRLLQGDNDWTYLWGQLEIPEETGYINIRWQTYGPAEGVSYIYADDVELMRWEEFQPFNGNFSIDVPSDLYYLQVQTRRPVRSVNVVYQTTTLEIE